MKLGIKAYVCNNKYYKHIERISTYEPPSPYLGKRNLQILKIITSNEMNNFRS